MIMLMVCLQRFYPAVLAAANAAAAGTGSAYCKYANAGLVLWTSSMFLGGKPTRLPPATCSNYTYLGCFFVQQPLQCIGSARSV